MAEVYLCKMLVGEGATRSVAVKLICCQRWDELPILQA